jgi:hypothetical protein
MLQRDLGGVLDLLGVPPSAAHSPAAAMAEADPTSPWQPTSAPEIDALCLISPPMAEAVSRKVAPPLLRRADAVVAVVAQDRGHHPRRAVGGRGHDTRPPAAFSSFTAMA